jgi:chorismate mutase
VNRFALIPQNEPPAFKFVTSLTKKNFSMTLASIDSWPLQRTQPLVVAGPCSAETEAQVYETASALANTGRVSLLRAGIWKPRTRPGSFQGIGEEALPWLVAAGKANHLPTTTEVANAQHVDACLKAGVDVLWIGARTTVNPFSVQEIADALKGVDVPVMVKNPINPDLELWIGAIERLSLNGISRIIAMHRGFSGVSNAGYRNAPLWEIPIALKAALPNIPILCDPSHITGDRSKIGSIAQKALDLGMDGLMIETHPRPDEAWSDAAQQVTPKNLESILSQLTFRKPTSSDQGVVNELAKLRCQIDAVDQQLLQLLAERMNIVGKIGNYKKEQGLTILQIERWKEIMETRTAAGNDLNLSNDLLLPYLELIHQASIAKQSNIMNNDQELLW